MKLRKIIIISCLIIIFISGWYSCWYSQRHFPSLKDYLENEEEWDGREIALNYRKVSEVGTGYFKIGSAGRNITVIGEIKELNPGDIISFKGKYQKAATIKVTDYYISEHRPLKYAVSLLAAFLSFLWLLANFRVIWKEFILVERNPCQTS